MKLAMHIIRIRNREVKDWRSAGKSSWTNMLKDATGEVSLNYGDEDKPEDVETRNDILNDFYRLAQREEEYREGEIGKFIGFISEAIAIKSLYRQHRPLPG